MDSASNSQQRRPVHHNRGKAVKPTTSATFLALSCVGSLISTAAMAADTDADASSEQQSERERRDEREQIIVTGQHYPTQQESPKTQPPVRAPPPTAPANTRPPTEDPQPP